MSIRLYNTQRCPYARRTRTHAGNFVRLRELEERGGISLNDYPNVAA